MKSLTYIVAAIFLSGKVVMVLYQTSSTTQTYFVTELDVTDAVNWQMRSESMKATTAYKLAT